MRGLVCGLVGLCMAVSACGGPAEPPVASPSVTLNHSEVPLGSVLEVTYGFDVFAEAPPIVQDYRVLAHFTDAEGETMWTDDHLPPTPTSQWQPGQSVTYTRTLFVPIYPYVGQAFISIGLYNPETGERVTLFGEESGDRAYRVASLELLPQSQNTLLVYKSGWHSPEIARDNPTIEWRWSEAEAVIAFRNPRRNSTLYLRGEGRPELVGGQQRLALAIGEATVGTIDLANSPTLHTVELSAAELGESDMVDLRLSIEPVFVPAEQSPTNPSDARQLGLRLFEAFLDTR